MTMQSKFPSILSVRSNRYKLVNIFQIFCQVCFVQKSFWWTQVSCWGQWYPCFGFLVTSPLGFKARVGSSLFACFVEVNVMYIPWDIPLVLHLPTSWWPANHFSTCISRGWTWLRFDRAITCTEEEHSSIVWPRLYFVKLQLSACASFHKDAE